MINPKSQVATVLKPFATVNIASIKGNLFRYGDVVPDYKVEFATPLVLAQHGNRIELNMYDGSKDIFACTVYYKTVQATFKAEYLPYELTITNQEIPYYVLQYMFPLVPFCDMGTTFNLTQPVLVKYAHVLLSQAFTVKNMKGNLQLELPNSPLVASTMVQPTGLRGTIKIDIPPKSIKFALSFEMTTQLEPHSYLDYSSTQIDMRKYVLDEQNVRYRNQFHHMPTTMLEQFFGITGMPKDCRFRCTQFLCWNNEHFYCKLLDDDNAVSRNYYQQAKDHLLEICYYSNQATYKGHKLKIVYAPWVQRLSKLWQQHYCQKWFADIQVQTGTN